MLMLTLVANFTRLSLKLKNKTKRDDCCDLENAMLMSKES